MVARVPIEKKKTKRFVIPPSVLARAGSKPGSRVPENSPFRLPDYPPLVSKAVQATMAMDDNIQNANAWATNAWVGGFAYNSAISEGLAFPGYAFLSELAQRPEYRRFAEITAMEMTRKWIKIQSKGDKTSGEDKTDKINELTDEMDRLQVRDMFRTLSEHDSYFGRGHLYIDTGDTNNREELKTSIGNGRNELSRAKIRKGSIKRLATVEPVWCYPTSYDSADPLRTDWYNPTMWYAMGKEIHATRLLKFVGRVVPDLLKPSYSFGGLSMSQMAKPYVDNWLRARQSVADIMHAFSVFVLETDLQESLMQGGDQLFARIELFNQLRDNRGLMVLNKDSEGFQNVAASLGSLDLLQAQAQEHLSSVSGIPVVKLLGIQPAGLNASSEGEIRTFYDWVHSFQEKMFRPHLTTVIDFIQLSLWGDIDDDLTFAFEELWSLDEASLANKRKTEVETDTALLDAGVISPEEIRQRIASDPTSPYASLDVDDLPDLKEEEEEGLEPKGSAEKLAATGSGKEGDGEQGEENEPTDEDDNAEDTAFKEDEHPRKDDGKFGKGGGGSQHKNALKDLAEFSEKPKAENSKQENKKSAEEAMKALEAAMESALSVEAPGKKEAQEALKSLEAAMEATLTEPDVKKEVEKKIARPKTEVNKTAEQKPSLSEKERKLQDRIEKAYLSVSGGKKNESIRISDIKKKLPDLTKEEVDAALLSILQGKVKGATLGQITDPKARNPDDRNGAFSPAGEPFHLLWLRSHIGEKSDE